MKDFWDQRYSESGFAYGTEPNEFLVAEYRRIPLGGEVLCLAEGEGRNAAFLAAQGYSVTAVDQSAVGLEKAAALAEQNGNSIKTIVADLAEFDILPLSWDGIVSISAHLPPAIRHKVHSQIGAGLKPGGVFLLEAYNEKHLEMEGIGGPPLHQREMFMSLSELEKELTGLQLPIKRELERDFNEGRYHRGPSSVVQMIATKSS